MNQRIGHYGEVRAIQDGAQVSVGGRLAGLVDNIEIRPADSLLVLAVEIVAAFVSGAYGGLKEGIRQRAPVSCGRHPHRALAAPVCPIAALRSLAVLEERKKIYVTPPGSARRCPLVITAAAATHESHFVVARPAQHLAPRIPARHATRRELRDSEVPPGQPRCRSAKATPTEPQWRQDRRLDLPPAATPVSADPPTVARR